MENKLRILYSLQLVDSALDELEELKGDLPAQKEEIESTIRELETNRAKLEETMKSSFAGREAADDQILDLKAKLEKYKEQQLAVRNNREYDALTREMDHAASTIARLEKEVLTLEGTAVTAKSDIEAVDAQLEETREALKVKEGALTEIAKTNEEEELKYRHEREKLLARIEKPHMRAYERIRKAKRGRAIVPVRRESCGGCFARVPPQKLLELRQNNKIYHCEHCGRILVSGEIAEATSATA